MSHTHPFVQHKSSLEEWANSSYLSLFGLQVGEHLNEAKRLRRTLLVIVEGLFYACRRDEYEEERCMSVLKAFVGGEPLEEVVAA